MRSENILGFQPKTLGVEARSGRRRLRAPNSNKPGLAWKDADRVTFLKWSAERSRRQLILMMIASSCLRLGFRARREDLEDFWGRLLRHRPRDFSRSHPKF